MVPLDFVDLDGLVFIEVVLAVALLFIAFLVEALLAFFVCVDFELVRV